MCAISITIPNARNGMISQSHVGKMQFSLSDIATPDSLVGYHKTQQDPIRLSSVVYQDLLRRVYQIIIYL